MKIAVLIASDAGAETAGIIRQELKEEITVFSAIEREGCVAVASIGEFVRECFNEYDAFVFVGAMGICVRAIAPCIASKYTDPAVVNVDVTGRFAVSVLSGHIGGANELTRRDRKSVV